MNVRHEPLLQIQRDLYRMPRGMERFKAYLESMMQGQELPALLPLVAMNPMAKEYVAARLDELLALDADAVAAAAVAEGNRLLPPADQPAPSLGLVIIDDIGGGWTSRGFVEMNMFLTLPTPKYNWISVMLWVSEPWPAAKIRGQVLAAMYRTAAMQRHGVPRTLGAIMAQEGRAARFGGWPPPALDPEDLEYTREVMEPYRQSDDYPTQFTGLFGDDAARMVGYRPLGLSPYAGLALAYAEAGAEADPLAALGRPDQPTPA